MSQKKRLKLVYLLIEKWYISLVILRMKIQIKNDRR